MADNTEDVTLSRPGAIILERGVPAQNDTSWYVPPPIQSAPDTDDEADWLLTCQDSGGAITETSAGSVVFPYMANYAAMGLARATEYTRNPIYAAGAWRWLTWYAAHMDGTTGYVDDYTVTYDGGGTPTYTDTTNKDSTDAYAGTYLVALYKTYLATGDGTKLAALAATIPLALTAIESTQQDNGLTYALPTYDVWYLEDNLETLAGARCAQLLAAALNNSGLLTRATNTADRLAYGIGEMWNAETGVFDYAIHSSHFRARNDWTDDNARRQQIWALAWSTNPATAATMQATYDANIDWTHRGGYTDGYEVIGLWSLQRLGLSTELEAALASLTVVRDFYARGYPWTCAISGMFIMGKLGLGEMPTLGVVYPNGGNLLPNPTLVLDSNADGVADGISLYGGPVMSLHPASSGNYEEMINDGTQALIWAGLPVQQSRYYTFSIYRKITDVKATAQIKIEIDLFKANGDFTYNYTYTFAPDPAPGSEVSPVDSGVVRWWLTIYIPVDLSADGAAYAECIIGCQSAAGTLQFAGPKFEQAGNPTALPSGPLTW